MTQSGQGTRRERMGDGERQGREWESDEMLRDLQGRVGVTVGVTVGVGGSGSVRGGESGGVRGGVQGAWEGAPDSPRAKMTKRKRRKKHPRCRCQRPWRRRTRRRGQQWPRTPLTGVAVGAGSVCQAIGRSESWVVFEAAVAAAAAAAGAALQGSRKR